MLLPNKKSNWVVALIIIIALPTFALAEPITRADFLDRLKSTHPLFERERLSVQIERKAQAGFLGSEDWNINSSVFYTHQEPSFALAAPEKTDGFSISGGADKLFWSTGGRLSASYGSNFVSLTIDPMFGLPDSYFEQRLSVSYVHPLSRNKHGRLSRLEYDLKKFDIDLSEVIAFENQENFLTRSLERYLDWVFLGVQRTIVEERLKLSEEQMARTKEKRQANLVDEVDLIRAGDAVNISRQNLLLIESQAAAVQSELAVLVQDENYYNARPEYDLYAIENLPEISTTTDLLKANSRLLQVLAIQLEKVRMARTGFAEMSKSDLSLYTEIGLKNAKNSFGKSLVMDKPDARIGLQYSFPVKNRTARANVARSDLQMLQLEKQVQEITLELSAAATNLLTRMGKLEEVLDLNRLQIKTARRKTVEELKLYDQGRGELTFVIQSRDSEQAARLTLAINALSYQKLLLQFEALTDQIIQ